MEQPNQITYESVCTIAGKLFLESRYEMERLTAMLLELQKKFSEVNQEKLKLGASLEEANQRVTLLEAKLNGRCGT